MINEITFQYPTWYIALCVLLGLVFAFLLYTKDDKFSEAPNWSKWVMSALRFLTITSLAILLLSPLLKSTTEEIKQPIVVIAEDASQSMIAEMTPEDISQEKEQINALASDLAEKYDVRRLHFGDKINLEGVDSFGFKVTNLSESLEYIYDNYGDQNLGAVVFSTDGIFNEGKNPLYAKAPFTAPIYVVAHGDTTVRKDLLIKNVFNNKISYLGDKFSIQVDISAYNCNPNGTTLMVNKIKDGNTIRQHSETIRIDKNDFFYTSEIILDANDVGVNKYRISLSPVSDEVSSANNYKDIFIEVLDARQKICLIADAPHPDLSALKTLITQNKNYDVEIHNPDDQDLRIADYDLIILHNLPSQKNDINAVVAEMNRRKIPRIFIVGAQSNTAKLNTIQENVSVSGNSASLEDIQADVVLNFNSFTTNDQLGTNLKSFPPLIAPFGQYSTPSGANVLLKQNIKKIPTDYPLLSFLDKDGYKTGVWVGEGVWRWRIYDYLENKNYDIVSELINKTVQYVTTKEDKRKFRVSTAKNLYKENEGIFFDAQLYNSNYEMINEPDVFLTIRNSDGQEYKYTYSRANNYYTLNIGMLPPDRYRYTATTSYGGEALSQNGSFSVQDIQLELYDLTARHDLLKTLSEKYGGEMVTKEGVRSLSSTILNNEKIKPVIYPSSETKSVINLKWLFGFLFLFLALEWFLRRYMGSY